MFMIRWILTLFTGLILAFAVASIDVPSAIAQVVSLAMTDSQLQTGEGLTQKAFAATNVGDFATAEDYWTQLIELFPNYPAAFNNRGNAKAALEQWEQAISDYQKAFELAPDYALARANYAIALYQTGETETAIRTMKNIVRKYPKFADMRAALTAALWVQGNFGEAESNWVAVVGLDSRYKNLDWVKNIRRWPPVMVSALEKFLKLQ